MKPELHPVSPSRGVFARRPSGSAAGPLVLCLYGFPDAEWRAQHEVVAGAGHLLRLEQPETVGQKVLGWFRPEAVV